MWKRLAGKAGSAAAAAAGEQALTALVGLAKKHLGYGNSSSGKRSFRTRIPKPFNGGRRTRFGRRFGRRSFGRRSYRFRNRRFSSSRRGGFRRRVQRVIDANIPWTIYSGNYPTQYTIQQALASYFSIDVGTFNTGHLGDWSTLLTALGISNPSTSGIQPIEVAYNWVEVELRNSTNMPLKIEKYYCAPRKTQSLTTVLAPDNALAYGWGPSFMNLYGSNTSVVDISLTPYMCPNFTTYYKIYKKQFILLQPGDLHTFRIKSKVFDRAVASDTLCAGQYTLGVTNTCLIKCWGTAIHDNTSSNTTTCYGQLDAILRSNVKGRCVKVASDKITILNMANNVTVPRGVVDESGVFAAAARN